MGEGGIINWNWHSTEIDVKISRQARKTVIKTVIHMLKKLSRNIKDIKKTEIKLTEVKIILCEIR